MAIGKTSLYIDPASEAILAARDSEAFVRGRHGRRSHLVREILRRYDDICRRDLPTLTETDWKRVVEAGRAAATGEKPASATTLLAALLDADRTLVRKLDRLTTGERVAIVDAVERYWAAYSQGERPPLPSLPSEAGVKRPRVATSKVLRSSRNGEGRP